MANSEKSFTERIQRSSSEMLALGSQRSLSKPRKDCQVVNVIPFQKHLAGWFEPAWTHLHPLSIVGLISITKRVA